MVQENSGSLDPLAEYKRRTSQTARLSLPPQELSAWSASRHSAKFLVHVGKLLYVVSNNSTDIRDTSVTAHSTILVRGIKVSATHMSVDYDIDDGNLQTLYHSPQLIKTSAPTGSLFGFIPTRGGFEIKSALLNVPVIFRYNNSPELSRTHGQTLFITENINP
jgi:hypothetical protein